MISDRAQACPKCGATVELTVPVVNRPSPSSPPSQYSGNSGNGNKSNGSLLWVIISLIVVVVVLAIVIANLLNTGLSYSDEYSYSESASASVSAPVSAVESVEASMSVTSVDEVETYTDDDTDISRYGSYRLSGSIGSYGINGSITYTSDGEFSGSYRYSRYQNNAASLTIRGVYHSSDGSWVATEYDNGEITGSYDGYINESTVSGTFINKKGKSFNFTIKLSPN